MEIDADQFPEEGRLLAEKTIDGVKAAYLSGEAAADDAWQEMLAVRRRLANYARATLNLNAADLLAEAESTQSHE